MTTMFATDPVHVRVPATSANLGPGYDCLGLALDLYDDVTARVTDGGISVDVRGEGLGQVPTDGDHLIVRTILRTFAELGLPEPAGLALSCHNRIPHARGLGSSSAAIVAGIVLARGLVVTPDAARLDDVWALELAASIEGHPDNVAACLLGGFTIAWTGPSGSRAKKLLPVSDLKPTVYIPTTRGVTKEARAALPSTVAHEDAAFNVARTALLVHALTADTSLLLEATEDRLHQNYRAAGMPESAAWMRSLRESGIPAFVSGAGPTVLALPSGDPPDAPDGWCGRSLSVSLEGARIVTARHAEGDPVAAGPPG